MKCLLQALFRNGILTTASSSQICRALGRTGREMMVRLGNYPKLALLFSGVNYCNFSRSAGLKPLCYPMFCCIVIPKKDRFNLQLHFGMGF
jgi:hypothetical protein